MWDQTPAYIIWKSLEIICDTNKTWDSSASFIKRAPSFRQNTGGYDIFVGMKDNIWRSRSSGSSLILSLFCGEVSVAVLSSCCGGCSELSSVWLLRFVSVLGFNWWGLIVRRFMVGFYIGVKWPESSSVSKGCLEAIFLVGLWNLGSWVQVRDGIVW